MKNEGFSLIELIIVIAIMAILVAIIAPNLTRYLSGAKEQTDKRNLDEVKHQVVNCISEAAARNVEVIDTSSGANVAIYKLEYDSSSNQTRASSVFDGVTDFAKILSESLYEATTASTKDKNNKKIEIKISKRIDSGYDVDTYYTS